MRERTIFYSWMTEGSTELHRPFIRECLERAIAMLDRGLVIAEAVRDRTSVDPADDIVSRISQATVMLADVSSVEASVRTASPAVMFELGCGLAIHGRAALIAIANTARGPVAQLPFELGPGRIVRYELSNAGQLETARAALVPELVRVIALLLDDTAAERAQRFADGLDALTRLLVYGTDLEDLADGPHLATDAGELLALARRVETQLREHLDRDLTAMLQRAIGTLERAVALPATEESWPRLRVALAAACSNVELGSRDLLKTFTIDPQITRETIAIARELAQLTTSAAERYEAHGDDDVAADELRRFGDLTYALRRYAEFPVLPEHPSFVEQLHPISVAIRKTWLGCQRSHGRTGKSLLGYAQLARDELTGLLARYAAALP